MNLGTRPPTSLKITGHNKINSATVSGDILTKKLIVFSHYYQVHIMTRAESREKKVDQKE